MLTGARRCRAFPDRNTWLKLIRGTRGTSKCRLRSYRCPACPARLGTGAVAGMPSKRGGTQIEGLLGLQRGGILAD